MKFGKEHKKGAYGAGHTIITKVQDGNLCLDHAEFGRFLRDSNIGDKAFSIISIAGAARQGKSFMMNLILRFFETKAWVTSNTMNTKEEKLRLTAFKVDSGFKSVTTGILLYNYTFEVIWKGKPMVIILMDTQGIFDRTTTKKNEAFILTIATLMSSVQIFNVLGTVDTSRFEALDNAIKYGKLTARDDQYLKLQNLIFLVRDRRKTEEECQAYLDELLENNESCSDEYKATRFAIKETFSMVKLFCLPKPGEAVEDLTRDRSEIKYNDIDERFLDCVDEFLQSTISPGILKPKLSNDGKPIQIRNLYKLMILCENQFKKSSDGLIDPMAIMEGEDRVAYESKFEQIYNEFVDGIQDVDGKSEEEVESICGSLSKTILQKFNEDVSQWKVSEGGKQYETKYRDRLTEQIKIAISGRVSKWVNQQARKKLEMKMQTELLLKEYDTSMKNCDTMEQLERKHDVFLASVRSRYPEASYDEVLFLDSINVKRSKLKERIVKEEEKEKEAKKLPETEIQNDSKKSFAEKKAKFEKFFDPDTEYIRRKRNEIPISTPRTPLQSPGRSSSFGSKVLRPHMIQSNVEMQRKGLWSIWIELMNEKANAKYKSKPLTTREGDQWREIKSLTLTENDMIDIYNHVRRKVFGNYWNSNLDDLEKWSLRKLNKTLFSEWNNITQIYPLQYFTPLQLPADTTLQISKEGLAKAGRMMGKAVGFVKSHEDEHDKEERLGTIDGIGKEFGDALKEIPDVAQYKAGKKKIVEVMPIYEEKVTAVVESYLDNICPALLLGYTQLKSLVEQSKGEIISMRERIQEEIEDKLSIYMRLVVSNVEEEFKKVMAVTHYDPEILEEKYKKRLDEGFEEVHKVVTHGHKIIRGIKDSVYVRAKVEESLKRVLKQNEASKGGVIVEAVENIPIQETRNIFKRFQSYVKSVFKKKQ